MVYITVRQSPIYHQMTLEEYLFQSYQTPPVVNANIANTRTYEVENVSEHFSSKIGVEALIGASFIPDMRMTSSFHPSMILMFVLLKSW